MVDFLFNGLKSCWKAWKCLIRSASVCRWNQSKPPYFNAEERAAGQKRDIGSLVRRVWLIRHDLKVRNVGLPAPGKIPPIKRQKTKPLNQSRAENHIRNERTMVWKQCTQSGIYCASQTTRGPLTNLLQALPGWPICKGGTNVLQAASRH